MPEQAIRTMSQAVSASRPYDPAVEAILIYQFPTKPLMDIAAAFGSAQPQADGDAFCLQFNAQVEAKRKALLELPQAELKRLHQQVLVNQRTQQEASDAARAAKGKAAAAAKEAAMFYNRADAQADFDHWLKYDYWTFDEAIALLMGKEPNLVAWAAVNSAINSSMGLFSSPAKRAQMTGFLRTYDRLRSVAQRAAVMKAPRLKPADVLTWARKTRAVELPTALLQHLSTVNEVARSATMASPRIDLQPAVATDGRTPMIEKGTGSNLRWTPELIEELGKHKAKEGTPAAAKHFGVSDSMVRRLLRKGQQKPKVNSVFNRG